MARRLLLLAGIAVCGVILFHGAGWGFTGMFAWAHRYLPSGADLAGMRTGATYAVFRLIEQLAVFSVPAFLFISGFFVVFATPRASPGPAWDVLRPRLVWLILPYLFWNAVVFVSLRVQGTNLSIPEFARLILTGSGTPAYYYIPVLVQLYLLSPLLVRWGKRNWASLLLITALCQAAISLAPYLIALGTTEPPWIAAVARVPNWLFVVHVFWFSLGILVGLYLPRLREPLIRWRWWNVGAAAALVVLGLFEWEILLTRSGLAWIDHRMTPVDCLYTLAILGAFAGFAEAGLRRSRSLEALGSRSYGIYLVHPLAMEVFARGVYHFVPRLLSFPLLFAAMVMGAGLALPLTVMVLFRQRALRPAYRYVFG